MHITAERHNRYIVLKIKSIPVSRKYDFFCCLPRPNIVIDFCRGQESPIWRSSTPFKKKENIPNFFSELLVPLSKLRAQFWIEAQSHFRSKSRFSRFRQCTFRRQQVFNCFLSLPLISKSVLSTFVSYFDFFLKLEKSTISKNLRTVAFVNCKHATLIKFASIQCKQPFLNSNTGYRNLSFRIFYEKRCF